MAETKTTLELIATTVQVISVVVGVIVSVLSFNSSRQKDAEARQKDAQARIVEAMKPLHELRRSVYIETVKTAAVIATPANRSPEEISKAKRRFRELYVAELSMVELPGVESAMIAFAKAADPQLLELTPAQSAAYDLSHALRDSYVSQPPNR
jgi:hypothetical protein